MGGRFLLAGAQRDVDHGPQYISTLNRFIDGRDAQIGYARF